MSTEKSGRNKHILGMFGDKKKSVLNFPYTYLYKGELTEIECKINLLCLRQETLWTHDTDTST